MPTSPAEFGRHAPSPQNDEGGISGNVLSRRDFLRIALAAGGATLFTGGLIAEIRALAQGAAVLENLANRQAELQKGPQTEVEAMIPQINTLIELVTKSPDRISTSTQFTFKRDGVVIETIPDKSYYAKDAALEDLRRVQEKLIAGSADPMLTVEGSATVTSTWKQTVLGKNYTLTVRMLTATQRSPLNTRGELFGITSNLNPEAPAWSAVLLTAVPTEGPTDAAGESVTYVFVPNFDTVISHKGQDQRSMPGPIMQNNFRNDRRFGVVNTTWFPGITEEDKLLLKKAFCLGDGIPRSVAENLYSAIEATPSAPAGDTVVASAY